MLGISLILFLSPLSYAQVWTTVRPLWNVTWHRSQNYHAAPVRVHAFDYLGDRLKTPTYDGWSPKYVYENSLGRQQMNVGVDRVYGHFLEYRTTLSRGLEGWTTVVREQEKTELYCRGARDKMSFFGNFGTQATYDAQANKCVSKCFQTASFNDANFSRAALAKTDWMNDCRVPLTHAYSAKAMNIVASGTPTASVRLPAHAFKKMGIERNELVDVLMVVHMPNVPVRIGSDNNEAKVTNPLCYCGANPITMKLTDACIEAEPSIDETNGYDWGTKPYASKVASASEGTLPTLTWQPLTVAGLTRKVDQLHGFYDFPGPSQLTMAPKMKGAASIQQSSIDTSPYLGADNTGAFVDEIDIVEVLSAHKYIVDVTPLIRRLWDTDHFEFAILGNGVITHVEPVFVFHAAKQWMYKTQKDSCVGITDKWECTDQQCTWCKKRPEARDYLDKEWLAEIGQTDYGRCGTPPDACVINRGTVFKKKKG